MILELLALSTGIGAVALYVARRVRRASPDGSGQKPAQKRARGAARPAAPPVEPASGAPRGLRLADVVLYADTELWLAGALHLEEDGFVMRVFRTPGSARAGWLAQLDADASDVALCDVTSEVPAGAVPESLPLGGQRLALRRRGHARVRSEGSDVPRGSSRVRYVELAGPGGRTLLVLDFDGGERLALLGDRVGRELLDLLPGGDLPREPVDV